MTAHRTLRTLLATACLIGGVARAADAPVAAAWQDHQVNFDYFATTSDYTCSGIEEKLKMLLLQFGARKDVHARAGVCNEHDMTIGHALTIQLKFATLAPLDPASASGAGSAVQAHWTAVEVTPHQPTSMGEGDCDLIEQLRDTITKNFASRALTYRATCTPHQLGINSFAVHGEFLKSPAS